MRTEIVNTENWDSTSMGARLTAGEIILKKEFYKRKNDTEGFHLFLEYGGKTIPAPTAS